MYVGESRYAKPILQLMIVMILLWNYLIRCMCYAEFHCYCYATIIVNVVMILGCFLRAKPVELRRFRSFVASAVASDTATPPCSSSGEGLPVSDSFDAPSVAELRSNGEDGEASDSAGGFDGQKMSRVCDKLIDVFMVDKPTPTDWRRLLVFSKEWDNIRPHFYKRCQDRADSEDDPGMKHKFLRLGRKLKEVGLQNC